MLILPVRFTKDPLIHQRGEGLSDVFCVSKTPKNLVYTGDSLLTKKADDVNGGGEIL
jgi:hypothetical protein